MNANLKINILPAGDGPGGGPPLSVSEVGEEKVRQDPPTIINFYGRNFLVTKDVLTPRPESEQIIDEVLSLCGRPILPGVKPTPAKLDPSHLTILDVGTGSGCLAITLKLELPEATVYATDVSELALNVASKNAEILSAPIITIISHLLGKVKDKTIPTPDLIVANLPYVDPDWPWLDKPALESTDPPLALYAREHGLALIKALIVEASSLGIPRLVLEADPSEHQKITKFAKSHDYALTNTRGFILSFIKII